MQGSFARCLEKSEQDALKELILARDLETTEPINTEASNSQDSLSDTTDSVLSFRDESQTYIEINLFLPSWAQGKRYHALLVSSSHPSFLVLHLHPPPIRAAQLKPIKKFSSAYLNESGQNFHSSVAPSSTRREEATVRAPSLKKGPGWGLGGGIGGGSLSGSFSGSNGGRSALTGSGTGRTRSTLSSGVLSSLGSFTRANYGVPGAGQHSNSHQAVSSDEESKLVRTTERLKMLEEEEEEEEEEDRDFRHPDTPDSESDKIVSCQELLETIEWEKTRMGPRKKWPGSLRAALSIMLKTPNESIICWFSFYHYCHYSVEAGADSLSVRMFTLKGWGHPETGMTIFYNDAHARAVAAQHPDSFGARQFSYPLLFKGFSYLSDPTFCSCFSCSSRG